MARHPWTHEQLVAGVLAGDHRAIARAISLVENREPAALAVVREIYQHTGAALLSVSPGRPASGSRP